MHVFNTFLIITFRLHQIFFQQWQHTIYDTHSECKIVNFLTGRSGEPRSFNRPNQLLPDRKKIVFFFNISLLMAGLYSFLYLYKALFIVIDFN